VEGALLDPEETMENVLMNAGRTKTVLLVDVHLGAGLISTIVGEISDLLQLFFKLIITVALEGYFIVSGVGLIASIGPFALCGVARDNLFLLLLRLEHLKLLDYGYSTTMPYVLHQGNRFL